MSSAYLLVSHGSRDPRPQLAVKRLAEQLMLSCQSTVVATAQLELADKPLYCQIIDVANSMASRYSRLIILPLFLLPGVHAIDDIPAAVNIAQAEIGSRLELILAPFLGSHPDLVNLFVENYYQLPNLTTILAHGSRRSGGNAIVEQLATNLGAKTAYWSLEPSLTTRIQELAATGATEIGILPYFLFAGGITDAIVAAVDELQQQFPQVQLILGTPIGNHSGLILTLCKIFSTYDS